MSIGIVIPTFNREELFRKVLEPLSDIHQDDGILEFDVAIVNDGSHYSRELKYYVNCLGFKYIELEENRGVGYAKNRGLDYILDNLTCEHIFIIEDDVLIKDKNVFQKYIEFSEFTGVRHLNWNAGVPWSTIQFADTFHGQPVTFYKDYLGSFSYFHRVVFEKFGLFDEGYKNAFEHIDYEYTLARVGVIPPFWYAIDFPHDMLETIDNGKSTITGEIDYRKNWNMSAEHFKQKWGHFTNVIPMIKPEMVMEHLEKIKQTNGK